MSRLDLPPAAGYLRVFEDPNGKCVDIHKTHGKQKSRQNLLIALLLAVRGERV